ncbi:MAG TPA: PspA/IM30 family protein [Thermomicrobiales bacterium]|nr:PspA/IM30 family protein [Thermomicrobiales bacterium]
MGILDRMQRLVRANVNDLIDRAEDPEKMIDQILRDMESNIVTARSQVAAMIAQEKELEADANESSHLADEWGAKAKRAVDAGKDDLAREALRRKRDSQENADAYKKQHDVQLQTVDRLKSQLQALESKYQQTMAQRDSLIARQRRAKASQKVAEFSANLTPLDASSELDRMERKIRTNEAQAAALSEMNESSVDAQFRELDYDVDIEKELEALKGGSSASAGQLEAGSSSDTNE